MIRRMDLNYQTKNVSELKAICKKYKITGISKKTKTDLINLIQEKVGQEYKKPDEVSTEKIFVLAEEENVIVGDSSLPLPLNKTFLEDCIEGMKKIPNNSIDMVCTDPPYFLDGLDNDWRKEKLDKKGSSHVIGNLPKGMKFDRNQSKKFYEFYEIVAKEIFRILKPGGVFISFSSPRLYHSMTMAIEESGFEIRDMLGWIYTQSQVKAFSQNHIIDNDKNMTVEQKEDLKKLCNQWKTPQLKPAIEPMCLAVKPIEGRYIDNFQKYGTGLMNTSDETKVGEGYFPSNIVVTQDDIGETMEKVFLVQKPSKKEKGDFNTHLSVKPVSLISHVIKLFTKEGAVILDPFMGSGTTAVACLLYNRNYIGFEINEEYIKIAEKRCAMLESEA